MSNKTTAVKWYEPLLTKAFWRSTLWPLTWQGVERNAPDWLNTLAELLVALFAFIGCLIIWVGFAVPSFVVYLFTRTPKRYSAIKKEMENGKHQ